MRPREKMIGLIEPSKESIIKKNKKRIKYRKLIRLRDMLHLHYLNLKNYLKL